MAISFCLTQSQISLLYQFIIVIIIQWYNNSRIVPFRSTNEWLKSIFAFVLIVVYLYSLGTKVFMIFQ